MVLSFKHSGGVLHCAGVAFAPYLHYKNLFPLEGDFMSEVSVGAVFALCNVFFTQFYFTNMASSVGECIKSMISCYSAGNRVLGALFRRRFNLLFIISFFFVSNKCTIALYIIKKDYIS